MSRVWIVITGVLLLLGAGVQDKPKVQPNRADEPIAKAFSLKKSVAFLDDASRRWRKTYGCVTCHTNGLFLISRPLVSKTHAANTSNRAFAKSYLERYVVADEKPKRGKGAIEGIVATTSFLAISDMATNGRLDKVTIRGLDHIWKKQDEDGAWGGWLKCNWPPFEVDDHFGATLVAVAVGAVPGSYRRTKKAKEGVRKLLGWLRAHPPANPHNKGMMLWAAAKLPEVVPAKLQKKWRDELLALQREEGGWRLVDLGAGKWKRGKDDAKKLTVDAYATGFAIFVLRKAGVPVDDERITKGLAWLRAHQRRSGRWFVRSPKKDGKHFISHAATQFAVMAFLACGETTKK